jgi:hypothetical protein
MEIELRAVGPDRPDALELPAAGRAQITARKAEEPGGEPRASLIEIKRMYVRPKYPGVGFHTVRLDTHDRLAEANRLYGGQVPRDPGLQPESAREPRLETSLPELT